jgi:hypothetical protein
MREPKHDDLLTVEISESAESRGDVLDALAALLVDVYAKAKTDDGAKGKIDS